MLIERARTSSNDRAPLNRFVTISWETGGLGPKASVWATGRFVTLARQWMRARGYPMPWLWVQEWGRFKGAHCHFMLHVPPELDELFGRMPRQWVKLIAGRDLPRGTLQTLRLSSARTIDIAPGAYQAELFGRLHYMLKCAPAAIESKLGMTGWGNVTWGQTCPVFGKRAAVSQALSPAPER